jgi:hypothetical protein
MLSKDDVIAVLTRLVEGKIEPDEWRDWWAAHGDELGKLLQLSAKFSDLRAAARQESVVARMGLAEDAAAAVLKSWGIPHDPVERFSKPHWEQVLAKRRSDQEARPFKSALGRIAEEQFYASCNAAMKSRLYEKYQAAGSPANLDQWIKEALEQEFTWLDKPPRWVGDPDWPCPDGHPAIFIMQYSVGENSHPDYYSDVTLFVFGYKDANNRIHHVVVDQHDFQRSLK